MSFVNAGLAIVWANEINGYPCSTYKAKGFPDEFEFGRIPLNNAYKQAGNTVCAPVIERIARNIRKATEGEK